MNAVRDSAAACFQRFHVPGTALAQTVIGGDGRVASCTVVGILRETPTGDCVCAAVGTAKFDRFSGPPMHVIYPFMLR